MCDDDILNLFCHDVVSRIFTFVDEADNSDLYEAEIEHIKILRQEAKKHTVDWELAGKSLDELSKINEDDEDHGLDMDHSIVEFLCALDNWRVFSETRNKNYSVCGVSENVMNILDLNFTEDVPLARWLKVPEINEEFNKQIAFLKNCN